MEIFNVQPFQPLNLNNLDEQQEAASRPLKPIKRIEIWSGRLAMMGLSIMGMAIAFNTIR
jgi:hypothetical protein